MCAIVQRALTILAAIVWAGVVHADPPNRSIDKSGVSSDDDLTIVVGTRFVSASAQQTSPKAEFDNARIPVALFNETDRCIDESALELAKDYFNTLGRALGKAGYFYVLPESDVRKARFACEKLHLQPPKAWVDDKTKIIAFGEVVPTANAPALEESIR